MKRLEQLLLSSQLEKEELKQINGGKEPSGRACRCQCTYGIGTWIEYEQSGRCPTMGWNENKCLDLEYTCSPVR